MIKHSLITAATLSLLIGCGSEDDSLLSLESYQPQNEANDVPVDSTITLSLNGPVNVVSLDSDLITLTSTVTNRSISGDISYDQNTQQVTFQPDHKLAVNTEYSVNLKAGVNDGANQSIDETNWSFTTNGDYEFQLMNLTETCNDVCDSELWLVADGGEVRQIANINPTNSSYPSASTIQYKGLYFVSAEDGTHGRELWVTDGTESYTELFADLVAGTASSYPGQFTQLGDYLYFTANNGTNNGTLWRTDGTVEGTIEVANPRPNSSPGISDLRTFNQKLIFTAYSDDYGHEIYISDGTSEGTQLIKDLNEGDGLSGAEFLFEQNGELFFNGSDGNDTDTNPDHHSYSLFKTDGTAEGTVLVKDINPTENSSSESNITLPVEFGDKHYFLANDGVNGHQLWQTDGTEDGTTMVKLIVANGINVRTMAVYNNKLYIAEASTGLWESDGTEAGTKLVKSFDYTLDLSVTDNGLIVTAEDGINGLRGYWLSDGTSAGTELFHDRGNNNLWLGNKIGNGTLFYEYNGVGTYYYYTDGTAGGTKILETPDGLNLVYSDF